MVYRSIVCGITLNHSFASRWSIFCQFNIPERALIGLLLANGFCGQVKSCIEYNRYTAASRFITGSITSRYTHPYGGCVIISSYSREAITSSVLWKCRFGLSKVVLSWFVCTLEWMSSIRPFKYLTVTWSDVNRGTSMEYCLRPHLFVLLVEIIQVPV